MLYPSKNFSSKPTLSIAAVVNLGPNTETAAPAMSPSTAASTNLAPCTTLLNESAVFAAAFAASISAGSGAAAPKVNAPCLALSASPAAFALSPLANPPTPPSAKDFRMSLVSPPVSAVTPADVVP